MLVPLSWLCEFAPLEVDPGDDAAVASLRGVLDGLGLVVESVERVPGTPPGVVLARVLEIHPIPGADRVRQVFVDAGNGERLEIVCGATNFRAGDVVPLAPVGTELPGGVTIQRRAMLGVTSNGMLCSGRELGLSEDAAGLLVLCSPGSPEAPLPDGVVLGRDLGEHLGRRPEVVFDVAVEPNRPDGLSIVGIARDLAAKLGLAFAVPEPVVVESDPPAGDLASVAIEASSGCDALVGRVVEGVAGLDSPALVRRRLELCGMRPISAVVDASNYVMLELGQPTHAYDLDRLRGRGIVVRFARPGEELVTLDGTPRVLGRRRRPSGDVEDVDDLVIADAAGRAVGVAGIMGGRDSEIGEGTDRVLLEVAAFDQLAIGATSARLGLRSEASTRFWRGVDRGGLGRAADRFCELVQQAAAEANRPLPRVAAGRLTAGDPDPDPAVLAVRLERVNALLGTDLDLAAMRRLLEPVGFGFVGEAEPVRVVVPTFRPDVAREVDVVEEVARHLGYDAIAPSERRSPKVGRLSPEQAFRRRLRRALTGLGANEAWTSSIVDPAAEERIGADGPFVAVANPIVHDETVLRTSLLPGLLGALAYNAQRRNGPLRLFEIGVVFSEPAREEPLIGRTGSDEGGRPGETEAVAVALAAEDDATSAVGAFGYLAEALGLDPDGYVLEQEVASLGGEAPLLAGRIGAELLVGTHPSRTAVVLPRRADPRTRPIVAVIGEVAPGVLSSFGLAGRVGWIATTLDALARLPRRSPIARPVSRFPSADIDLSFVLDDEVPAGRLADQLRRAAGERFGGLELIDTYRGEGIPAGTRSLTFRLRLVALDHTLEVDELAEIRAGAIRLVEERLPARLRD